MILNNLKTFGLSCALVLGTFGAIATLPTPGFSEPASAQSQPQSVIAMGSFVTVEPDHPTGGTARIVSENGKRHLEFDSEFTTAQGPDVQVILHRSGSIPVNLDEGDYVTLAALQQFGGTQRYAIPDNIDIGQFKSVGIWCREFNVTFGYAAL